VVNAESFSRRGFFQGISWLVRQRWATLTNDCRAVPRTGLEAGSRYTTC
jgi:hypothetical protein